MKKYNYLYFTFMLLSLICMSCGSGSSSKDVGNDTPENFGKSILHALKTNDTALFKKYVYTKHEVEYLNSHSKDESSLDRFKRYYKRLSTIDKKIKAKASEKGLNDWDGVKFSKFSYSLSSDGLRAKNTQLEFTDGDFVGNIKFRTICKSDRGWFITGVPEFSKYKLSNSH